MSTLWVGGSSGLAQTYVNHFGPEDLILAGLEERPPVGALNNANWHSLDLTQPATTAVLFGDLPPISTVILGVRAPLVTGDGNHVSLLDGIQVLMEEAAKAGVRHVFHISSVGAAEHLRVHRNESEEEPLPPLGDYKGSYDVFKRKSEDIVTAVCQQHQMNYCHLRLSAIFSDTGQCIQCGAMAIQSHVGAYFPIPIDCNSSRNAAVAIRLLVERMKSGTEISTMYYYTRPTLQPIPYGEYLMEYRRANDIAFTLWLPFDMVQWCIALIHWLVWHTFLRKLSICVSIDYLLQVSAHEHSFDNSRFRRDIPELATQEETIYECFVRRRRIFSKAKAD